MRMYDIILKKRNGSPLNKDEIDYFVQGYTQGNIPDYQASALLMAIYFKGMNHQETINLTQSMVDSGDSVNLSEIKGIKVDKHSTGGVGDKTTIALAPLVAACGVPVAKLSGRGLGHTGGTIDKLESIPGFSTSITNKTFINNINEINLALAGQTANLAPADKKLYSLRDVTATVDNIPLIASSIMSKKLALGTDAIVLDVKAGNGAFMKNIDDAFSLAKEMVNIGNSLHKDTIAIVTDMDQPLGYTVGNSLEVKEAIDLLRNKSPRDLKLLTITLGAYMLLLSKVVKTKQEGMDKIQDTIESGKGLELFKSFIKKQGGDIACIENTDLLPQASTIVPYEANKGGYIHKIKANIIGSVSLILGAGRNTIGDKIDLSVGIVLNKKVGDYVTKGETLAFIHLNKEDKIRPCIKKLADAYLIKDTPPKPKPLIYGIITKKGVERL